MTYIKNIVKAMLSIVACAFLLALTIAFIPFAIVELVIVCLTIVVFDRIVYRDK